MYPPFDAEEARALIAAHADQPGAALPVLHALQARFGAVPAAAIPLIAAALNLTRAEVHGIVSFYHDFRSLPPGRHVLRLCRAEACQSMGGAGLAQAAQRLLGIGWHETTTDGRITLEPVFCLGLCAVAPAALLDDAPLGRLDAARLQEALENAS